LSSRGTLPDAEEVEEIDESNSDDEGGLIASEVREIVAGVIAGGVLSLFGSIAAFGVGIIDTIRSALTNAGGGIAEEVGSAGDQFVVLVIETPLEAAGDFAASTWIFAPVVSALIFALVAAMAAGIIYGTWRAVVIIT